MLYNLSSSYSRRVISLLNMGKFMRLFSMATYGGTSNLVDLLDFDFYVYEKDVYPDTHDPDHHFLVMKCEDKNFALALKYPSNAFPVVEIKDYAENRSTFTHPTTLVLKHHLPFFNSNGTSLYQLRTQEFFIGDNSCLLIDYLQQQHDKLPDSSVVKSKLINFLNDYQQASKIEITPLHRDDVELFGGCTIS